MTQITVKNKPWPKDGSTVQFSDLVTSIEHAMRFAYILKRRNVSKNIPWSGYDIGDDMKTTSPSPADALTKDSLAWQLDQGREAMEVILSFAVQLGIEQGKRCAYEKIADRLSMLNVSAEAVHFGIGDLLRMIGKAE